MRSESGQVLVEAAIVLPLALFAFLALLQLALLQEARLLLEYAGYRAARTGSLWNGDPEAMAESARFVLGPTVCPSRWPLVPCPPVEDPALRAAAGAQALRMLAALGPFPGLQVKRIAPEPAAPERDFDRFAPDEGERRTDRVTVELIYWFELRIPVADAGIWHAWRLFGDGLSRFPLAERLAVRAAAAAGRYYVPLRTRHTMQAQSNLFPLEEAP